MKKIAVWGWWQGNNLGDNWIKKTIRKQFPYAEFIDTSVKDFSKYDFVICGGGGLFIYDVIFPWKEYNQGVPFGMLGLGAEFPHESNIAYELSKQSKFFYVRDEYSINCMKLEKQSRSYDITLSLPLKRISQNELDMDKLFFVWRDGKELTANSKFAEYIQYESVYPEWEKNIKRNFKDVCYDDFQTNKDDIEERISGCGFVISGRYHGILAAIQKGIPFVAIDICPKIRALVQECGLEEYCIKISEVEKIDELIKRAKKEVYHIRKKEEDYVVKAQAVLQRQIKDIKEKILKTIKPLKVIHYGSYWMKENDVVNTMADDLNELCELKKIDLNAYGMNPDSRIKANISTPNGCICILDDLKIKEDIKEHHPDCIILNSGGLVLEDKTFKYAKEKGIITVGISLSDPDVYPYNGNIYAQKYDLFYSNSKYSISNQYRGMGHVKCMPFAASIKHHFYIPEQEKIYDIVIVGHARKDRINIVNRLSSLYKVGVYGNGWRESNGVVNGIEHVKAINSGKMYLSFAQTQAGYENIKVGLFEAMACNQVVVTKYMKELEDYFSIGEEILCYNTEKELEELITYYLEHDMERECVRKKAYARFLEEHTYTKRWIDVLMQIWEIVKTRFEVIES